MASRKYTAQEMREAAILADTVEVPDEFYGHEMDKIAAMLRQAADAHESEEKREKKYECKGMVKKKGVPIWCSATYDNVTDARGDAEQYGQNGKVVVFRREVGEWEEVSNG